MNWLQQMNNSAPSKTSETDVMFPILVDHNQHGNHIQGPLVLQQSYTILDHLWTNYGQSVLPTSSSGVNGTAPRQMNQRRPDQILNGPNIPFPIRFLLLAAPSYLRPWPHCGLFRLESRFDDTHTVRLYQSEGCAESRLVRELLCSFEIPYESIPCAVGSRHAPPENLPIPVLSISKLPTEPGTEPDPLLIQSAQSCLDFLHKSYGARNEPDSWLANVSTTMSRYLYRIPKEQNLGNPTQGNLAVGAYTAFLKGSRSFVPPQALD